MCFHLRRSAGYGSAWRIFNNTQPKHENLDGNANQTQPETRAHTQQAREYTHKHAPRTHAHLLHRRKRDHREVDGADLLDLLYDQLRGVVATPILAGDDLPRQRRLQPSWSSRRRWARRETPTTATTSISGSRGRSISGHGFQGLIYLRGERIWVGLVGGRLDWVLGST